MKLERTLPYEPAPTYWGGLGFIPINSKFICRAELQSYQILQKALEIEELLSCRLQKSKILQTVFGAFISSFRVNFPHSMGHLVMQFLLTSLGTVQWVEDTA